MRFLEREIEVPPKPILAGNKSRGNARRSRPKQSEIAAFRKRLASRPTNKKRSPEIGLLVAHFEIEFVIGYVD
jgi:hypothetical protein